MHDDATTSEFGSDEQRITEALRAITERRAVIEQAKGMLMLIYRLDADQAFAVLRECSQHGNVKLRLLARQIVADFCALPRINGALAAPDAYTQLLRTAHLRVTVKSRDVVYDVVV